MKRLVIMAVMAAFILGTVGMAQAVEIKAKGDWQMSGNFVKNPTFDSDAKMDEFQAWQRLRTAFEFVANENLKAVLRLHIENKWGDVGHDLGASGKNGTSETGIGYDLAYLDFMIPNTQVNIKAGKQLVTMPNSIGSHILDDFAYSVVASIPFNDMAGLTVGWARAYDDSSDPYAFDPDHKSADEYDLFLAILPINLDGVQLTPFGAYGRTGKYFGADPDATTAPDGKSASHYWAGLNFAVSAFDPFVILGDFNYGARGEMEQDGGDASGWIGVLAMQYNMDMFTPRIYGLYESGESSSSYKAGKDSKIMPTISGDLYGISSFGFNGTNFRGLGRARVNVAQPNAAWGPSGKWGLGLKLMDITFMEKLSHEFQIGYYKGTNDKKSGLFSTEDSAWETNFNTSYQMYENLAAILELGYMDVDLKDVDTDAAWKAAAGFRFKF